MHVLHQGRAEYVLIYPPNHPKYSNSRPIVKRTVMGPNTGAGEVRQLYVESGVWKKSSLLKEDISGESVDKERIGCLITEVVSPGFDWQDHRWLGREELEELFPEDEEVKRELAGHVKE